MNNGKRHLAHMQLQRCRSMMIVKSAGELLADGPLSIGQAESDGKRLDNDDKIFY